MQNILDYLEWRGDLSFERDGFNEVDNLILSALAYIEFDGFVSGDGKDEKVLLSEIAEAVFNSIDREQPRYKNPFFRSIPELLIKAANTVRFGNVGLSFYVNRLDYERNEQFSAMVFSINARQHYVAFRGTDDTLAGWKEDFQMSFMDEVPAQKDAVEYLQTIKGCFEGCFFMGGHSKGGNLAVYAAASMEEEARGRIAAIYNNDGPGFQADFIRSQGYKSILERITTVVPKSSIVGMLLEHREEYMVVNSDEKGILQHNVFSWEVRGKQFVYHEINRSSINLNKAVRLWLSRLPLEERALFVDELFNIIYATGAMTVSDLYKERLEAAEGMIKSYKNINPESRRFLKSTIRTFLRESQKVLKNSIEMDIEYMKARKSNHQSEGEDK